MKKITMMTIKECLIETPKNEILDIMTDDRLRDIVYLLEHQDMTIREMREKETDRFSAFIDLLISLQAEAGSRYVAYLYDTEEDGLPDPVMDICKIEEIREDIDAPGIDMGFSPWEELLGVKVAENKLTQDHLPDLLAQAVRDASMFGLRQDARKKNMDRLYADLKKASKEKGRAMEDVFEELSVELGLPIPEKDAVRDELSCAVQKAVWEHDRYCRRRERRRILEGLQKESEEEI